MTAGAIVLAFIGLFSGVAVVLVRIVHERGREPREQAVIEATAELTMAQAKHEAEEAETMRFDRMEKLWAKVEKQQVALETQSDQIDELKADLDIERRARITQNRKIKAAWQRDREFALALISKLPPPPPEFPAGWEDIHDILG